MNDSASSTWQPSTELAHARELDANDPLAGLRGHFHIPAGPDGRPQVYLVGNSLGLATTATKAHVDAELDRWADLGVGGHFTGDLAWAPYHELLTDQMAYHHVAQGDIAGEPWMVSF